MSQLNLQVTAIAFDDIKPSNNPQIRAFDLTYKLTGVQATDPVSRSLQIPPQTESVIFNGTRATAIDNTTAFTTSRPNPDTNTYRFTSTGGTPPVFRTDRGIAIDGTTAFSVTVNGPVATLTNSAGTAPNFTAVQIGDVLNVQPNSGASLGNTGLFVILAKTTNSLSIQNLTATVETFTILDPTLFLVYSNGAAGNQVQIGDKVIVSSGFSPATFGTYQITDVTPLWFEVSIAYPNGIPEETGITPTATGLIFYSAAKQFVLIAAQQRCAVKFNGDATNSVELLPVETNNPEKPALLLKQGTAYSLSINNLSLDTLNVLVASAE